MNNACEDIQLHGMKCCKYENLTTDEFVYSNVAMMTQKPHHELYLYSSGYYVQSQTYSLTDIQQFVIVNSNISKIPNNLFQNMKQLKYLDVLNSSVRSIFVADFFGANQLTYLNLTKNVIETLEPKLFVHAQNLIVLDMSYNRITNLSEYAFDHLDKLQTLILSNNRLFAFEINQRFIDLEVFSIDDNMVNVFGERIFQNSSKLREVNLRNNKLHIKNILLSNDVILDIFDIGNNFVSVSLSSKQISIQNTGTTLYSVHRNVQILDASNNQIFNIEFESNIHLTSINLSRNSLTSMKNLTHLKNLQQLDLSFNSINDFAVSSFSEMNNLRVLNLKRSGLTSLDFGTFSQQTQLIFLDISDNNLKKINFDMLLFVSSLSELYIDGNQLTNIDVSNIKNTLPNITTISISRNLFRCNDLISILKTLNSFHINLRILDNEVMKNDSNVRGIKCFSSSNDADGSNITQLSNNFSSNSFSNPQEEMLHLKSSLEALRNEYERRYSEHVQNLSSLNEKFNSFLNENLLIESDDDGSDLFRFAFMFLLIVVILFVCGFSIIWYCKFHARRRWYIAAAKQNTTNADQTLV